MLSKVMSAALGLSLLVTAVPLAHAAKKPQMITVSNGVDSKRIVKPILHHYPSKKSAATSSIHNAATASSSGCYEVTANFTLVPCGARPHSP